MFLSVTFQIAENLNEILIVAGSLIVSVALFFVRKKK